MTTSAVGTSGEERRGHNNEEHGWRMQVRIKFSGRTSGITSKIPPRLTSSSARPRATSATTVMEGRAGVGRAWTCVGNERRDFTQTRPLFLLHPEPSSCAMHVPDPARPLSNTSACGVPLSPPSPSYPRSPFTAISLCNIPALSPPTPSSPTQRAPPPLPVPTPFTRTPYLCDPRQYRGCPPRPFALLPHVSDAHLLLLPTTSAPAQHTHATKTHSPH
ncbi:hypothetical protein R3P38DRAFT_1956512 [Favolaschia claudopus]|uniref:Uncharacterized protein n=1 Tax=Favolaschia claudopus TaxID=2862362 RepID=A0AAW0A0D9_9AGAR